MKALVTGGAGFIGSHVVDAYLAEGLDVVVVDDLSRGSRDNVNPRAKLHTVDVRDGERLREIFASERPDFVNHHAAQMDLRRAVFEPIFDAEVNVVGSIHLLSCAVEFKVRRLVYASTGGAAYGEPTRLPLHEEHPVNPITPYGISKHTVEHYLFTYAVLYGLEYMVLRYGNVYGPRQSSKGEAGVVAIFCEQMLQNITPRIFGDGHKTRDYVHVTDVARANVLALSRGHNDIVNIGCGVPTTDYEIFNLVRTALGVAPFGPRFVDKRPGEIDHCWFDVSKAKRVLGWEPETNITEGLARTAPYFKERFLALAGHGSLQAKQ